MGKKKISAPLSSGKDGFPCGHKRSLPLLILFLVLAGLFWGPVPQASAEPEVTLAWNESEGASGYRLFIREEGQAYSFDDPLWEGPALECTVTSLLEHTSYFFVVRAFDENGIESANSNEVRFPPDNDSGEGSGGGSGSGSGSGGGGGGGCFVSSLLR